jgi:hypothetical protein
MIALSLEINLQLSMCVTVFEQRTIRASYPSPGWKWAGLKDCLDSPRNRYVLGDHSVGKPGPRQLRSEDRQAIVREQLETPRATPRTGWVTFTGITAVRASHHFGLNAPPAANTGKTDAH